MGRVDISCDRETSVGLDGDVSLDGRSPLQVLGERGIWGGQCVLGDRAGDLRSPRVEVEQERCRHREIAVVVENAQRDRMGLAIAQQAGKRSKVYAVGNKIESLG